MDSAPLKGMNPEIERIRRLVNEKLAQFSVNGDYHRGMHAFVEEAHALLLSPEAKRVRSIIPVLLAEDRGFDVEDCLMYGVVIELLHFTSLVHDDVIDNHELRRGRQTLNRTFTNSKAVLTGDYLMYEVIKHCLPLRYGPEIIDLVVNAAKDMVAGVVMEQDVLPQETSLNNYLEMARRKTGSLFALSFGLPFVAEDQIAEALECGYLFGTAFQIYDDRLDQHGDNPHENIYKMYTSKEVADILNDLKDRFDRLGKNIGIQPTLSQVIEFLKEYGYFT